MNLKDYIVDVPNYPKEGIIFKDITPLLNNQEAFNYAIDEISNFANSVGATVVLGPESRGFIFGCPVACELNLGFVPIRKPGKLPRETIEEKYDLEYGSNTLCIHSDAIKPNDKVVIIDDLLATGGTLEAAVKLVKYANKQSGYKLGDLEDAMNKGVIHYRNASQFKETPAEQLNTMLANQPEQQEPAVSMNAAMFK